MGVKGLSTFVKNNQKLLLRSYRLHHTRVIIDGNNLVHYFSQRQNHISLEFGGDYDRFADTSREFFNNLKRCHIQPYVVFDGAHSRDDRKLNRFQTKAQSRRDTVNEINHSERNHIDIDGLYAILAKETLKQVLAELGIAHVSCHFEADREIAVLAKKWRCPIISNDSDFLVYDLEGGVVSLDNISTQLLVYDKQTKDEFEFDIAQPLTEHQILYSRVKIYMSERFTSMYSEKVRPFVLPLFGTVLGNDFIDDRELFPFYQTLRIPSTDIKFDVPDKNEKMRSIRKVLHWLNSIEDLANVIDLIVCTNSMNKDIFRQKLMKSIEDYQNLQEFSSLNLVEYFDDRNGGETDEASNDLTNAMSNIVDYNGAPLPRWFVDRLVSCEIGSFIHNASIHHRNFFACQVELLENSSSYMCCTGLRQIIYGMLKIASTPDDRDRRDKNKNRCVVEFDRIGHDEQQNFIEPITELSGFGLLPSLDHLKSDSEANRKQILLHALAVPTALADGIREDNESSIFLVAIVAYWFKHSEPNVSENDVISLLVCVLFLHLKWLTLVDGNNHEESRGLHADIVKACRDSSEVQLSEFNTKMNRIISEEPYVVDVSIVHCFAQFQSCFEEASLLNQLLLCPVQPLHPSVIFSGSIVYKLFRVLRRHQTQRRDDPHRETELIVGNDGEVLLHDSPLHQQFVKLRKHVEEILNM